MQKKHTSRLVHHSFDSRTRSNPSIAPKQGDLIVSNWTSYVELVYLAFRFNPVFALPIHEPPQPSDQSSQSVTGRQTGTGSSNINLPSISAVPASPLLGYLPVGLFDLIRFTGLTPAQYPSTQAGQLMTLERLCQQAPGPVVMFPEGCTTNGRGLLRFGKDLFGPEGWEVPVRKRSVWVCLFK